MTCREKAAEQAAQELAQREEQARGLVRIWDGMVKAYGEALPRIETDPALGGTRDHLLLFSAWLEAAPQAVMLLRERGAAFGLEERPNLTQVVAAARPEPLFAAIVEISEREMRTHLKAEAELARQREEHRLSRGHDRGMSMGM